MGTFDSADAILGAQGRPAPPCVMVIFGAAGDLTKRKLIPALYNLAKSRLLPDQFAIVGVSREEYSIDEFRTRMAPEAGELTITNLDRETWDWFAKRLYYLSGDFQDPKLFKKLEEVLAEVEKEQATQGNCLFYLATSPTFFPIVVKQLGLAHLTDEVNGKWRRVVIEKPFGHDLATARCAESRNRASAAGKSGLPHRPLSGEGDGPEYSGVPLRQRNFRAGVESALRRSRPGYGGGRAGRRTARRLLRQAPALCATWCRIISSS